MRCNRKRNNLFIKIMLFFVVALFSIQLCAKSNAVYLNHDSVDSVFCGEFDCFFPAKIPSDDDIYVIDQVDWNKNSNLIINTKGNIIFKERGKIISKNNGSIILKSGMEPGKRETYESTVVFEEDSIKIEILKDGKVEIYYNPLKGNKNHKYHNGKSFTFSQHIKSSSAKEALDVYMLVNDIQDLQDINRLLSGNYALSQNIDATETKSWNKGKGFQPIKDDGKHMPFSGNFNGNGYAINNLFINRPDEDNVGLFGECSGFENRLNLIKDLILYKFDITGDHYVGSLVGEAVYTKISDLFVADFSVVSRDIAGGIIGRAYEVKLSPVTIVACEKQRLNLKAHEYGGLVIGTANKSKINSNFVMLETSQEALSSSSPRKQLEKDEDKLPEEPYLGLNNHSIFASDLNILKSDLDIMSFIRNAICIGLFNITNKKIHKKN